MFHGASPWHHLEISYLLCSDEREKPRRRAVASVARYKKFSRTTVSQKTFQSGKLVELFGALKSITVGVETPGY